MPLTIGKLIEFITPQRNITVQQNIPTQKSTEPLPIVETTEKSIDETITETKPEEPIPETTTLGLARSNLSPETQRIYDEIVYGVANLQKEIPISANIDDIQLASNAVMMDHPEFFWLDGSWTVRTNEQETFLVPPVVPTQENIDNTINQMNQIADEMVHNAGPYDHEIAWSAYCSLIENCEYDLAAENQQTAFGALIEKRAVCAGYARAFQYIMHRYNIPCGLVTGTCEEENHMWCIAKIDGIWCQIDPTWGDSDHNNESTDFIKGPLPEYFGMTDEDVIKSKHTLDKGQNLPTCDSNEQSPLTRAGLIISQTDENKLSELFWSQIDNNSATFKFDTEESWVWAQQLIDNQKFLKSDLQSLTEQRNETSIHYMIRVNDMLQVVQIII